MTKFSILFKVIKPKQFQEEKMKNKKLNHKYKTGAQNNMVK